MTYRIYSAFALAAFAAFTMACSQSASGPNTPSPLTSSDTAANADGSTLKVTAPATVSPTGGIEITDLDPDLVIDNATGRFVSNLVLSYVFEVIDSQNRVVYRSDPVPQGDGGQTTHEIGLDLNSNENHTWRAYAVFQGHRGPMSGAAAFKTFDRFGVSCAHLAFEPSIVACRRAQFGFMSPEDRIDFLRKIAWDLNRAPAEHAPYGILIKAAGHNCLGYSCDIICSGQGNGQRQWDVLEDEDVIQAPVWNRVAQIAARPCEFITQ